MKTPDEIKRGLECCAGAAPCKDCPYFNNNDAACARNKNRDALERIQQLERELNAAVKDVRDLCASSASSNPCDFCKYEEPDGQCHHHCLTYTSDWGWEWRGAPKEEENETS